MRPFSVYVFAAVMALSPVAAFSMSAKQQVNDVSDLSETRVTYDNDNRIYSLNWTPGTAVTIAVSQTPDSNDSQLLAEKISSGHFLWQGPEKAQRQFFIITPEQGDAVITASRLLPADGALNFRDLGGYQTADGRTVKWGKLYRSSMLAHLTADDYQMIKPLHIGTIADLRSNDERAKEVTDWKAGEIDWITTDYNMDYSQFRGMMKDITAEKAKAMFTRMYPGILKQQTSNYRAMFEQLLEDDDALLFHCSAGKDRTGMAAMLILTALGVPQDTVMKDYLLSNQYYAARVAEFSRQHSDGKNDSTAAMMSRLPQEVSAVFMGVSPEYLQAAIDTMIQEHGSVMNYLHQALGMSDDDIAALRDKYLM